MSMDPDFAARYLNEQDADDGPPSRSLDHEPDVGAEPQAPAQPSVSEPVVPPARPVPDWEATTRTTVFEPRRPGLPAPSARPDDQRQSSTGSFQAAPGSDFGDPAARHASSDADHSAEVTRPQAPVPPRPFTAGFSENSGPMQAAPHEGHDFSRGLAQSHRPSGQPFAGQPPAVSRPQSSPGYEVARHDHQPTWDASGSSFADSTGNAPALRAEDVVAQRKLPPEMGWRKTVYVGSGKTINLGAGPAELRLRDQIDMIKTNIPGNYSIGVVCVRGGVGKTRTTAGLGTAFATYRTEPVIAIDANPTYGGLGRVIDPTATASIRDFLADNNLQTYPMARHYTGKNKPGLEVLGANQNVANPFDLTPNAFDALLGRVRRFYQLSIIDCGPEIEHPVMKAIFSSVDALVIVGTMNYDGAAAAETTIKWLAARSEYQALLQRSALVLNDVYNCADKDFMAKVRETIGQRVGGVTTIPWDEHLRDSPQLDFDALRGGTQYAYRELAAWLAQGFRTGRTAIR
jgi:MinD-like ATPase involved in chromosome partitioning or flagellar assembly